MEIARHHPLRRKRPVRLCTTGSSFPARPIQEDGAAVEGAAADAACMERRAADAVDPRKTATGGRLESTVHDKNRDRAKRAVPECTRDFTDNCEAVLLP